MSEGEDIFDKAFRLKVVGTGWIFIGACFLLYVTAVSIAHYYHGEPIYRRHGRGIASEGGILFALLIFGLGGIGAIFSGFALRRRARTMLAEKE